MQHTARLTRTTFTRVAARSGLTAYLVLAAVAASSSHGEDWPQWRGVHGDGIAASAFTPSSLQPQPKVRWTAELGAGYSIVSVVGSHVYTMGNIDNQDIVYCLQEETGKEVWRHTYPCKADSYPGPRATPCVVDGRVYTLSREGQVHCLNAASGEVIWKQDVAGQVSAKPPQWGFAGSPVVQEGALLLNVGTHGVALNPMNGKPLWQSPAGTGGYSTPVVATINGSKMVILFGAKSLYGVDLKTGQARFSHPWDTSYDVNAADPIVMGNTIFISSGYGRGCALLDVSTAQPKVVWENKNMSSQFSTPVLLDANLYGVDGNAGKGQLTCLNPDTGTVLWCEELGFGSLVAVDKTLIFLNERGDVHVARATPTAYSELAAASGVLPGTCWTMPVLCDGNLYLRNDKGRLVCLAVQ